ncbi:cytochrome P450 2K4-like isoform X2 [Hemicordylus capensis]|uniref:cytochrome P450 2K4-like isoform X2 n=1 Tax=Hemicordylus capensis TaxID=884348 RepID=UPI0023045ACD|nr:cytochrome P450 2K4-like isoform X2 [Hemicordylus capensis]
MTLGQSLHSQPDLLHRVVVRRNLSFWNSRNNKHFPPGPRPLPIIGNLHIMDMKKPYTTMLKGTEIMPLLASVLQDETQWEKPYKFYPEHFLDSDGKFVKRDAFMPFSAGFWNSRNNKHFPPGPRPLPIIGNLHIMDMKKPYTTMLKLSKQYGSIFSVQMGLKKVVVLTGYETVKEALVNQADAFAERPFNPMLDEISKGHGLVFARGENWKVMRRFTLTTLRDYGMGKRTIEDKIVEECRFLIRKFETYEGKPFEIKTIMNASVSNIIVSILLGKRFEYEDPTFLRLLQLINENIQLLGTPSVLLYSLFPALGFLSGAHKTVLNNRDEFQAFVTATFIEHLKELDENDQRSFIDSFLIRQQEEKKNNINGYFHNDNLIGVVANLFAAGTETTSTTLRWGLLLMMKYPDIQRKVQEEIATVVGSSQPRIEHRTKMPYADAVIHEIQRFGNIIPTNLPHATTVDVTLNGYFIPKGTEIMPLLASVLQDETQWEKPYKFYPEHFLDSDGKFVKRDAFMPFSAGRRICVGETLAKMELFLFFASLLQKFTFQPAPGTSKEDLDLTPADGFTTPPMPYKLCAVPRS